MDYSAQFGILFVKDLQYVNIYYVQIEKVAVIDENIKKSVISRK